MNNISAQSIAALFADNKKLAAVLKEGIAAYINPPTVSAEYSVTIEGLNHMNEPAPGAGADKCAHIEFSQEEPEAPIVTNFRIIDKDSENGGVSLSHAISVPRKASDRIRLEGKLLPWAACVLWRLRRTSTMSAADIERLLTLEAVPRARRAIFGKETVQEMSNTALSTALLAFKPIPKSTRAVQVIEAKDHSRSFDAFLKILNDDINQRDEERQKRHGEQPFKLCAVGLKGKNELQINEGERALCLVFGKHPVNGHVTVHIVGSPGVPAEQEHVFVPVNSMKEETFMPLIHFWAARLVNRGLKGEALNKSNGTLHTGLSSYRKTILRTPEWQSLAAGDRQFLLHFPPVAQSENHLEWIRALAAKPIFQHGAVSVSQTTPGGPRARTFKRPRPHRGDYRFQPEKITPVDFSQTPPMSNLELFDLVLELTEKEINQYVMDSPRSSNAEALQFELTVSSPGKKQRISDDIGKNRLHMEWWAEESGEAKFRIDILRAGQEAGSSYEYPVPCPGPRADPNIPHFPFMPACVAMHLIIGAGAPEGNSLIHKEARFRSRVIHSEKWRKHGRDHEKVLVEFQPGAGRAPTGLALQADDHDAASPPKMPRVLESLTGRSSRAPTTAVVASQRQ